MLQKPILRLSKMQSIFLLLCMQEVTSATFDLEDIRAYRIAVRSRCHAAASAVNYPRVNVDFELTKPHDLLTATSAPLQWIYHTAEEEIAYGPAAWL